MSDRHETTEGDAALRKELGVVHVFCIAAGAMISSGLFILPGIAHAQAGPAVVLSYLLAGVLAGIGMMNIAELATAMPKAGGDYFFISRGLGPAVGTVAGLLNWFSLSLKSAFALVGIAAVGHLVLPRVDARLIGLAFCIVFVLLNLRGAREAARLQVVLVFGLLALMALYIVKGIPEVDIDHFRPFAPTGLRGIFATTGLVFVAYGGLLNISSVAEESREPGRTIPRAMVLALAVVMSAYTLMVFVTSGVLGAQELDHSLTPISDGAAVFMGQGGRIALSIAAMLAFVTTANAGILAASRYLLAVGRDGMLPAVFARLSPRRRTPIAAVLTTGGLAAVVLFVDLYVLVEAASTVFLMSFILSSLCVIVLREGKVQNYRPRFRVPLYPWLQIAGIVGFAFVILEMGEEAFFIAVLLCLVGFAVFWFYGRQRVRSESALAHLVERLTDRPLVTGTLEAELKEIVRERDEIVTDRFDHLIEHCPVLDLKGPLDREAFFRRAAEALAPTLGVPTDALVEALRRREEEASTVLRPDLAIPHVVVEGEGRFDALLVRAKEGIRFGEAAPAVRAVLVLAGSKDERNFHLRALAAIAQVAQAKDFERRWLAARGTQALRDVILLEERRRR